MQNEKVKCNTCNRRAVAKAYTWCANLNGACPGDLVPEHMFHDGTCECDKCDGNGNRRRSRERAEYEAALHDVADAARELRDSGYDGPFLGEVTEPLFKALRVLESAANPPRR